jgi:hypothetical protein
VGFFVEFAMSDDLKKINDNIVGWTVDSIEVDELIFIVHLSKGKDKKTVNLYANDFGGIEMKQHGYFDLK